MVSEARTLLDAVLDLLGNKQISDNYNYSAVHEERVPQLIPTGASIACYGPAHFACPAGPGRPALQQQARPCISDASLSLPALPSLPLGCCGAVPKLRRLVDATGAAVTRH